jgi:hypothetical protein
LGSHAESGSSSTIPPPHILGWPAPLSLVIARSDSRAITAGRFIVYPQGFEVTLSLRRPRTSVLDEERVEHIHSANEQWLYDLNAPDTGLRIEVDYPDGTTFLSEDEPPVLAAEMDLSSPYGPSGAADRHFASLIGLGSTGAEFVTETNYWVAPIPSPGTLTFRCEWTRGGIRLNEVSADASLIREAASRSVALWEE